MYYDHKMNFNYKLVFFFTPELFFLIHVPLKRCEKDDHAA